MRISISFGKIWGTYQHILSLASLILWVNKFQFASIFYLMQNEEVQHDLQSLKISYFPRYSANLSSSKYKEKKLTYQFLQFRIAVAPVSTPHFSSNEILLKCKGLSCISIRVFGKFAQFRETRLKLPN